MGYDLEALEALKPLQIVRQIAERPSQLTGREVRLLRQHMEWSARKLAEEIGCDVDDVARCEWNDTPLPPGAERSLRWRFLPVSRRWKTIVGTAI
jgi:DNA-binding transcriptional regulator YiaG